MLDVKDFTFFDTLDDPAMKKVDKKYKFWLATQVFCKSGLEENLK